MVGLNKMMAIGNVGTDPEMRYTPNGNPVTSFRLATGRSYTASDGERKQETEWFTVVAWNQLAEQVNQYLAKGRQVYVEGRLSSRTYEGRDGTTRVSIDVFLNDVQFLGRGGDGGGTTDSAPYEAGVSATGDEGPMDSDPVDDLPF